MDDRTVLDLFRHDLSIPRPVHCVHLRPGWSRTFTTDEVRDRTVALAEGFAGLGIRRGDRVMILCDNRPEWHFVDLALLDLGVVTVPIYATLTPDQIAYQAVDSGAVAAVVEGPDEAARFEAVRNRCPALEHLVQVEGDAPPPRRRLEDLMGRPAAGAEQRFWERAAELAPDDLVTVVYTSGTTGEPKGVMLTHRNLVTNVREALERSASGEVGLEFLPLCHMIERIVAYCYMRLGTTRAYCSVHHVAQVIGEVRPSVFATVPRVLEKIHGGIHQRVASGSALRRALFRWALDVGHEAARRRLAGEPLGARLALRHRLADRLVLAKVRAALGGRLQTVFSGGAALPLFVNEFFHALGISVQEAYGLTETSPILTMNGCRPRDQRLGSVGRPLPSYEIRLAPDGELLARGPSVFSGYWNKPERTAEAFDEEGFFRTGDIASIDEDGFVFITDRKKELIVTSGGKNIAPQPIENRLKSSPYIDTAVLIGDGRPYVVALISPDLAALEQWATANGVTAASTAELVERPEVEALLAAAIEEVNADLARFEQIKRFRVLPLTLTTESGHLTPTLKLKRRVVAADFREEIEGLFASAGRESAEVAAPRG